MNYRINSANSHPRQAVLYRGLSIKTNTTFLVQKKTNPDIPKNTFNIPVGSKMYFRYNPHHSHHFFNQII